MKSILKTLFSAMILASLLFTACKKDDDPVGCNYVQELQDELNAVNAAATTYGNNPTPANCQAYKDSFQAYLNELEDHIECATLSGQQAELQASIDSAQASLDALQC
jgi:hypothetical protein